MLGIMNETGRIGMDKDGKRMDWMDTDGIWLDWDGHGRNMVG